MYPQLAAWMFQEAAVGWDPVSLWKQMGILAKIVVIILFIMSGWSIGVMIDRAMAFSAARKPVARICSRRCRRPPRRQDRRSHQGRRAQQEEPPGQGRHRRPAGIQCPRRIGRDAGRADRSLPARSRTRRSHRPRRTEARPGRPGHHRLHRSLRRTVRNRGRHSERLQGNFAQKATGLGAVAGGISEAW